MKLNRQGCFNKVWDWFIIQRKPKSVDPEQALCVYRGPDGACCAMGLLIPDEHYLPDMEGQTATILVTEYPELMERLFTNEVDAPFLVSLQKAHDKSTTDDFHARMEAKLRDLAGKYDLTIPEVHS